MRYYYEKPKTYLAMHGRTYSCKHPIYSKCTLYEKGFVGLAVIQQRYDPETKFTYWTDIDPWLVDDIFSQPGFDEYFHRKAKEPKKGLYPTVTVRQIMWALKMKSLPKPVWETVFDHPIG